MPVNQEIENLILSGDIILTTKDDLIKAVMDNISHLYDETSEFRKNRYMSGRDREFTQLSEEETKDIAKEILDYLTR